MRRSSETAIVKSKSGHLIGVHMKPNFVSEHECGINRLQTLLGLEPERLGISARIVLDCTKLFLIKGQKGTYLCVVDDVEPGFLPNANRFDTAHELHGAREESLSSAWSDKNFCIFAATGSEAVLYLEEIYEQAKLKNVVIGKGSFGVETPFMGPGLAIFIASGIPNSIWEETYATDLNHLNLEQADLDTNIKSEIKTKYANTHDVPRVCVAWAEGINETRNGKLIAETTAHPVIYCLLIKNHSGWYTVEEIRHWLSTGEGIIGDRLLHA